MNLAFLNYYFSGPEALGQMGMMIVLFYLVTFLIVAILRGQVRWTRGADGNFHLSGLVAKVIKAETIPLAFLVLGMFPFFWVLDCIWDPTGTISFECTRSDYYNGNCDDCPRLAVYERSSVEYPRKIKWIPSLANAYGWGVLLFQVVVLVLLAGVAAFVFLRILWGIGELVFIILSPPWRFVANQLRKIPLRL